MKRLFDAILAHPKLMLVGAVLLAAIGWRVAQELPVDVFPEIREPRVVVQVEAGGLSAEEVEQFVTIPIEAVMNGIPGVRKVRPVRAAVSRSSGSSSTGTSSLRRRGSASSSVLRPCASSCPRACEPRSPPSCR